MVHFKYRFLLVVTIAAVLVFMSSQEGFCLSESNTYEALVNPNASGVMTVSSFTYNAQIVAGQPVSGLSSVGAAGSGSSATTGFDFGAGFMRMIDTGLPAPPQEYEIYDIRAFSYSTNEEIISQMWQMHDDPYFRWSIKLTYPIVLILGYSVALDEEPDDIVDTTEAYYNGFLATPVSDGVHTFYVKAATTGGIWGESSGFEFWVDTHTPQAENLDPATGSIITDNSYPISLTLTDSASGVDSDTIGLSVNNGPIGFTYKDSLLASIMTVLPNGYITAHIQAGDIAGNILNMAWGFIVDANIPIGSLIINGGEEATNYARVRINLEASDETTEVVSVILSNDGIFDTESWEDFQSFYTDWILDEPQISGLKSVYGMLKDEAGNISAVYSDDIMLLSAAIDTLITSGPYSPTQDTSAQFDYQSSAEGAFFSYRLDSGEWSEWSLDTMVSFSDLEPSNHVFSVKSAKDYNEDEEITEEEEDPVPAQWTWIITFEEEVEAEERVLYWRTE